VDLTPGTVLAGRYRVDRILGAGGIGQVWAAKNIAVGSDVAVKVLFAASASNKELVMRFRREAYLLARVRSDHVARVLDLVSDDVYGLFLVLELIDGETLLPVLKRERMSVESALDLATDLARGLMVLHQASIVHRDIKPGNIILEKLPQGRPRAVIVDFGLGRVMSSDKGDEISGITNADTALGTLEYMAPEQILNSRGVNATADIYSLGAIIYRAVTGEHLYGALEGARLAHLKLIEDPPPFQTGRTDPKAAGLERAVDRMLARHPEQRYQSSEEVLEVLMSLHRPRRGEAFDEESTQDRMGLASTPSIPAFGSMPEIPATHSMPPEFAYSPSIPPPHFMSSAPPPRVTEMQPPRSAVSILITIIVALGILFAGALLGAMAERTRNSAAIETSD